MFIPSSVCYAGIATVSFVTPAVPLRLDLYYHLLDFCDVPLLVFLN